MLFLPVFSGNLLNILVENNTHRGVSNSMIQFCARPFRTVAKTWWKSTLTVRENQCDKTVCVVCVREGVRVTEP